MKKLAFAVIFILSWIYSSIFPPHSFAENICDSVKMGQKVYWDNSELKQGQIGKISILSDTPLYKLSGSAFKKATILKKGNSYRIYNFKKTYLGVGGGYYITRDSRISYRTPSKLKLQTVACANRKTTTTVSSASTESIIPRTNKIINLGPQVLNQSTLAAKAGMDQNGNAYLYVILHGTPSALAVVDLNTNETVGVYALSNSTSAWGIDVDPQGTVWVGGTNNGNLYSYNPNDGKFIDHGQVLSSKSDTSIQDIYANDQYVYGSTAYGGNVFKYNKATQSREFILNAQINKQYAKSIVVDSTNNYIYVSTGSKADLLQWNLETNSKTSILADQYKNETYMDKLKLIDDRYLLMKLYPSKKAVVYDLTLKKYGEEFNLSSRVFSEKNGEKNEFYYTDQSIFFAYNLETGQIRNTHVVLPKTTEALSMDFIHLKSNPDKTLLTGLIDNNGTYFIYDPEANKLTIKKFESPSQPVDLHFLFESPDQNNIYVNGFMSGGLTQYNPLTHSGLQLNGISQIESGIFVNGKMYVGTYPKALILEINNPAIPWDQQTPTILASLKDDYDQSRVTALAAYHNHLYAGTYPQYSASGGLILDYDLNTNQYQVYENYINNQSIITLHSFGEYIYGGTSVYANYEKSPNGAKLFRFNPSSPSQIEFIPLPLQATMIMSLITGPDQSIWGAADGTIFSYNPETKQFRTVKVLNAISGRFSNAHLLVGKDGYIYGTMEGRLFKMDPKTMKFIFILESGAYDIAQDSNGNIYYRNLSSLCQYAIK